VTPATYAAPHAVVSSESLLVCEMLLDVFRDPLAEAVWVHARVEELGSQVADDGEVNAVLDVREGIPSRDGGWPDG